jgi:hypothetical protein
MVHLTARTIRHGASLVQQGAHAVCRRAIPTCTASACLSASTTQHVRSATVCVSNERHAPVDTLSVYEQPALYDAAFTALRQFKDEVRRAAIIGREALHDIASTASLLRAMAAEASQTDFLLDVAKQHAGRQPQSFLELGCVEGLDETLCTCNGNELNVSA